MNAKEILEGYLNEMEGAYKEMNSAKNSLLDIALSPFEPLFVVDKEGNRVINHMEKSDLEEVLKSFNEDLIPMYEESSYQKGLDKVNEWKKLIEENLEN